MSDRRVMRSFKLNEISAVDFPAQKGARATILKRDDREPYWKRDFSQEQRDHAASTGAALPDGSFPIQNGSDLENAIHAMGRASDPAKAKAHIIARAKSLGMSSKLPDGWMSKNEGIDDMTEAEVQKMIADAVAAALEKAGKKPAPKVDPNEPDADDETAKAWRAYVAKAVDAAVTKAKADAKVEFDKAAEIAKGDEVIVDGAGNELRKSAIGDAAFKFLKAQADTIELTAFEKKAQAEIGTLPGELALKAKILRAVSKMDKEIKEGLEAMLKGGAAALKSLTKSRGSDISPEVKTAEQELEALTKAEMEKSKTEYAVAYSKVLESPEGQKLYNDITVAKRAASQGRAA